MKKKIYKQWWFIIVVIFIIIYGLNSLTLFLNEKKSTEKIEISAPSINENKELTFKEKAVANYEKYPAKAGSILYGKDFEGIEYYFEGEVVGFINLENNKSVLVKNSNGYVLPINIAENNVEIGQELKIYGTLSGSGYASDFLGTENVVGMTGFMNASSIE